MKSPPAPAAAPPRQPGPQAARRLFLHAATAAGGAALMGLSGGAAAAAGKASKTTKNSTEKGSAMFAYVGSRTTRERNARGEGITVYRVDQEAGTLETVQVVRGLVNPSFLALSRSGEHLYCVHGDLSEASAFKVDRASGQLTLLNRQDTQGKNPVHLAIDPTGRHLVVSNHLGSSLAVLPINADGSLGVVSQLVTLDGPLGPHRTEQKLSKPHFNPFTPDGRHVLVQDKGLDRTFVFRFADGRLAPADPAFVASREGAGPRHMAFHPNGRMAYVVNELDSTVTACSYAPVTGRLAPLQILTTLPASFTGNSRASEIEVDAAGRFLYASNRGDDSVAIFRIDPATGLLAWAGAQASGGKTPRFFALTQDQRHMFVLNEDSDSIVAMAVDRDSGQLQPAGFSTRTGSPVCMVFSRAA